MKLNFPKIVKEIDLSEYADAWGGQTISVWVNPPSADLVALGDNYKKALDEKNKEREQAEKDYLAFLSVLLSQGEKDTTISVDELEELQKATEETDPAFWVWFQNRVITEINDHRLGRKKA